MHTRNADFAEMNAGEKCITNGRARHNNDSLYIFERFINSVKYDTHTHTDIAAIHHHSISLYVCAHYVFFFGLTRPIFHHGALPCWHFITRRCLFLRSLLSHCWLLYSFIQSIIECIWTMQMRLYSTLQIIMMARWCETSDGALLENFNFLMWSDLFCFRYISEFTGAT